MTAQMPDAGSQRPDDGRREARLLALALSVFFILSLALNALAG